MKKYLTDTVAQGTPRPPKHPRPFDPPWPEPLPVNSGATVLWSYFSERGGPPKFVTLLDYLNLNSDAGCCSDLKFEDLESLRRKMPAIIACAESNINCFIDQDGNVTARFGTRDRNAENFFKAALRNAYISGKRHEARHPLCDQRAIERLADDAPDDDWQDRLEQVLQLGKSYYCDSTKKVTGAELFRLKAYRDSRNRPLTHLQIATKLRVSKKSIDRWWGHFEEYLLNHLKNQSKS